MTKRWFTSDLHLRHRLVVGLRGYEAETTDEGKPKATDAGLLAYETDLAAHWDAVVGWDDYVYILGDLAINATPEVLAWIKARPGTKRLISGNHDQAHPMHSKATKVFRPWLEVFETIHNQLRIKVSGETVILSHFPFASWGEGLTREGLRHPEWRVPEQDRLLLLHGHTHGLETAHGNSFHVGLDAHNLQLVPESTIQDWVADRQGTWRHLDMLKATTDSEELPESTIGPAMEELAHYSMFEYNQRFWYSYTDEKFQSSAEMSKSE